MMDKVKEIIKLTEKEIGRTSPIKNKILNADLIKTIKAMGYEKIKALIQKEE